MISALVPGSFDPPTKGHVDIVEQCVGIFDRVVVAVIANPSKTPMFTLSERLAMIEECCGGESVDVDAFDGLLVDYAAANDIDVIVKGLRAVTDFEYEIQMSQMNRQLSEIVTLFVATKPEYGYLSSSLVKQVASFGRSVDALVPAGVARALKERLSA